MAKITIAGDALIISSAVKYEDLAKVAKYRPDALVLKDAEGEPVFRVACGQYSGVSEYGITFETATREGGYACITLGTYIPEGEDVKEFVADTIGAAIGNLEKIETTIPDILGEIDVQRTAMMSKIQIAL